MKYKTKEGIEFEIDKADEKIVSSLVWRLDHGYIRNKNQYLHRLLMSNPVGVVDHIDGNPLNNKRSNLRVCSQKENVRNQKARKGTSQYKGVSWLKRDKRWYAYICNNYKTINLGLFKTELDAAKAYNDGAIKLFGKYAKLNDL